MIYMTRPAAVVQYNGKVAVSWLKILAANPNPRILSHETATLPCITSHLEQVANLLCAQANTASYP